MMTTHTQDLCERLSHVEGMRRIGPLIAEARATIEAQAERIAALEAKCALLAMSLDQEEKRSAALEAGLTDGVTDDMAVLQSRVEELEAQLRERGEPVARVEETPVGPKLYVNDVFVHSWFGCCYDDRVKAIAASINGAHPPAAAAAEDKRDAERYRWLLSMSWGLPVGDRGAFEWRMPGFTCCAKEPRKAFDERIDAGIAAQKERQENGNG
jgi:hypothetical protein